MPPPSIFVSLARVCSFHTRWCLPVLSDFQTEYELESDVAKRKEGGEQEGTPSQRKDEYLLTSTRESVTLEDQNHDPTIPNEMEHQKTGRVCVVLDPKKVQEFDPTVSITIHDVIYNDVAKRKLRESVLVFQGFLRGLEKENARKGDSYRNPPFSKFKKALDEWLSI